MNRRFHSWSRCKQILKKVTAVLAVIVVFTTTYALILPAITLENTAVCGQEEHQHEDSCYAVERVLICGQEEDETHSHTEECYAEERQLICGLTEHVHVDSCFDNDGGVPRSINNNASDTEEPTSPGSEPSGSAASALGAGTEQTPAEGTAADEEHADAAGVKSSALPDSDNTGNAEAEADEDAGESDVTNSLIRGNVIAADGEASTAGDMLNSRIRGNVIAADEKTYEITVTYDVGAGIPDGAELYVREILPEDDRYDEYYQESMEKVGVTRTPEGEEVGTTAGDSSKTIKQACDYTRIFDIQIRVDGQEIQPKNAVAVEIVLRDAPEDGEAVPSIVHFAEDGAELMELEETTGDSEDEPIRFVTDEFSVYTVVYTVDFEYSVNGKVYDFNLPGGEKISLSELIEVLGIPGDANSGEKPAFESKEDFLKEVDKVEFSDESLVQVTQNEEGHDWTLESLQPFDTEESLIISMKNGDVVTVKVTDAQIKKTVIDAKGDTWEITVTYDEDAGIPDGAELEVREVTEGSSAYGMSYEEYVASTEHILDMKEDSAGYIRLFDIRIVDQDDHSVKYQPKEGASVGVRIELADVEDGKDLSVVHFTEESSTGDAVNADVNGQTVVFEASGFSVYAIVDAPEPVETQAGNAKEIAELDGKAFYISLNYKNELRYLTGELSGNEIKLSDQIEQAKVYHFSKAEGSENKFYIWYADSSDNPLYISMTAEDNGKFGFTDQKSEARAFTVETITGEDGVFYISSDQTAFMVSKGSDNKKNYWQANGANNTIQGSRNFYDGVDNITRRQFTLSYANVVPDDPYSLDGKTYGIAYHSDSAAAAALMAETKDDKHLVAKDMLMRPDVTDNDGVLLVSEKSDISEWTFHNEGKDRYSITTEIDGKTKYLTLNGQTLTLGDDKNVEYSVFTLTPGTGENSGKWHIFGNGYCIEPNLNGNDAGRGFWGTASSAATTWLNLVKKSADLDDDDFVMYSAKKVSVSDTVNVSDGKQVILYTRIWNDTKKKYEFFVVDYNGTLIQCYDTGDNIEWIGAKANRALWTFTEGKNSDGTPSYYYWLENTQFPGTFIRPEVTSGQVIYTSTQSGGQDFNASMNLNGRRYGENYSTIIAWDDDNYAYAGLKAENGRVVACALSESEDFYFAVVNPVDENDSLSTVATIDNNDYGITMKMVDFNNEISDGRDSVQNPFFGGDNNVAGLLSPNLDTSGYPSTTEKTGTVQFLSNLYKNMTPVNRLFLQSIYNESGYFEYDSTQNFATLRNENGELTDTFTVYDQIAAIGQETGSSRAHGQFMPYNSIKAGEYAYDNNGHLITNRTDVLGEELSDISPRKGEKLYSIPQNDADYYFGMELEAGFTQTANGLDAWDHDIIFEFSGDDDFWLYVDDVLVLDLGGVHSASTGTVNFRTGKVEYIVRDGSGNVVRDRTASTTLYEIFQEYYKGPQNVEELFETKVVDGETVHVFKDFTNHTMKVFYMERGAGASNLHMRFNLAAVKPGTVELSKKLSGTDSASNSLIEFPYQIYYRTQEDGGDTYQLLAQSSEAPYCVTYKNSVNPVKEDSFTPAGGTVSYDHAFFLKPGQTAVIEFPEGTIDYYIVECGVNSPAAYDEVRANGDILIGRNDTKPQESNDPDTGEEVSDRKNFSTTAATTADRPQVEYDNHVANGAMRTLSITKNLFDADENNTRLHYDILDSESEDKVDKSVFEFRLYLGNEYIGENELAGANLYPYYVKNREGYYCSWDRASKSFQPLEINDYEALQNYLVTLSDVQKEAIVFTTSPNGSISKIPSDYTVEVHDLIIGTKWKVEERDWEIPKGYTRRDADGYLLELGNETTEQSTPVSGTMQSGDEPKVTVQNQRGWGLTVKKVWTDKDFMESHDDIYFAVYYKDEKKPNELGEIANIYEAYTVTDEETDETKTIPAQTSLRQLKDGESELYYFFEDLKDSAGDTHKFLDYVIREVTVSAKDGKKIVLDDDGYVTNPEDVVVTPVVDTTEGDAVRHGTINVGGKPIGGEYHPIDEKDKGYDYTVIYKTGTLTGYNNNIRTDTVTNSRPGIALYKTDWNGGWSNGSLTGALSGAAFTLVDSDGKNVAAADYTSSEDGLITIAYLSSGEYTLKEISTPKGYVALPEDLKISVDEDGTIQVTGPEGYYTVNAEAETGETGMTAVITVKNGQSELKVVKVDAATKQPIEGVHFALYHQITEGEEPNVSKRIDYNPIPGYKDLVTNTGGVPTGTGDDEGNRVSMDLSYGTYYLRETQAAEGYDPLTEDLCFKIGTDGKVTIEGDEQKTWLSTKTDKTTGKTTYTITIPNGKVKRVSFLKVDIASADHSLAGAEFDLYQVENGTRSQTAYISGLVSDENGMLAKERQTVFDLPTGVYHLIETKAPAGYVLKTEPVVITVTDEKDAASKNFGESGNLKGINYDEGTTLSESGSGIKYDASAEVYTLKISNSAGIELPSTGGPGTRLFTILGNILILGAGVLLWRRRRLI